MRQTMLYNTESDSAVEKRAEKADRIPLLVGPMESPSEIAINRTTSKKTEIQMRRLILCCKFKITVHP
jgi:CRISPR/Cas system CSM-associated protein Csm3 (group 7 of RAMP superfamily)